MTTVTKKALGLLVESEKGNGSAVSSSQTVDSVEKVKSESNTEKSVEDSKSEDKGNRRVRRHRLVDNLLQEDFQSVLDVLAISAKTPDEL
ncbi:hypothetical protein SDJN02_13814, partial [Cucurbita argyrosperma subsp. argyrosperma]